MYVAQLCQQSVNLEQFERFKQVDQYLVGLQNADTLVIHYDQFVADDVVHLGKASLDVDVAYNRLFQLTRNSVRVFELDCYFESCGGERNDVAAQPQYEFNLPQEIGQGAQIAACDECLVIVFARQLIRIAYDPLRLQEMQTLNASIICLASISNYVVCDDGAVRDINGRLVVVSGVRSPVFAVDQFVFSSTRVGVIRGVKADVFDLCALFGVECEFVFANTLSIAGSTVTAVFIQVYCSEGFKAGFFKADALNKQAAVFFTDLALGQVVASGNTFAMQQNALSIVLSSVYISLSEGENVLLNSALLWQDHELKQNSVLSPFHGAIERRFAQLAAQKAVKAQGSQPIMFHPPKSTISRDIPFGELQKQKKMRLAAQKQAYQKLQNAQSLQAENLRPQIKAQVCAPTVVFNEMLKGEVIAELHYQPEGVAAKTAKGALCLFKVQNKHFKQSGCFNFAKAPDFVSLHKDAQLALAGVSGTSGQINIYDQNSAMLAKVDRAFSAASFLFAMRRTESVFAASYERFLSYYYYKQKQIVHLARFPLALAVKQMKTFVNLRSPHVMLAFAGFDLDRPTNPYFALFDSEKTKFAFEVLNSNAPFQSSVDRILIQDYELADTHLVGLEAGGKIALYDVRRSAPVCVLSGRWAHFVGEHSLFFGASSEVYDFRAGKVAKVQGMHPGQCCALGTKFGCFYGVGQELGYFSKFE